VLFREDCDDIALIDVIEGNRKYIKVVYVYNKIDQICLEDVDRLARMPHSVVIGVHMGLNLE
jgi:ribosome-interacting GTPase 1